MIFPERRAGRFTEKLSMFMVVTAALGSFFVLLDPKVSLQFWGQQIGFGGTFSADLKGAIIMGILVGGWVAVKEYWLGASASGQTQAESMSRIAEASTPTAAEKARS